MALDEEFSATHPKRVWHETCEAAIEALHSLWFADLAAKDAEIVVD